jgi:hypothetical protein
MFRLAHYFNKNIHVCIPSLFDDQQARSFKLVGIEESGLWLESAELAVILASPDKKRPSPGTASAFFPFSHIAWVMPELGMVSSTPPPVSSIQTHEVPAHTEPPTKTSHHHSSSPVHKKLKK